MNNKGLKAFLKTEGEQEQKKVKERKKDPVDEYDFKEEKLNEAYEQYLSSGTGTISKEAFENAYDRYQAGSSSYNGEEDLRYLRYNDQLILALAEII